MVACDHKFRVCVQLYWWIKVHFLLLYYTAYLPRAFIINLSFGFIM
jgi:hypothetical protein